MGPVVTISSTFGSGGRAIGQAVAERLAVPFVDRAVPAAVAERLAVPITSALYHDEDERSPSLWSRLARGFAYAASPFGPEGMTVGLDDPEQYRQETERVMQQVADTTGGVVLGRAGMVVLRGRPNVLCVRLDGPVGARIAQAVRTEGMDEAAARSMQRSLDGAREAYARALYGARQSDPSLYHLVLDTTVLAWPTCVELIVTAATHLLERPPAGGWSGPG